MANTCAMGFVLSGDKCWKCGASQSETCGRWVTAAQAVVDAVRGYINANADGHRDDISDAFAGLKQSIHYLDKKPNRIEASTP